MKKVVKNQNKTVNYLSGGLFAYMIMMPFLVYWISILLNAFDISINAYQSGLIYSLGIYILLSIIFYNSIKQRKKKNDIEFSNIFFFYVAPLYFLTSTPGIISIFTKNTTTIIYFTLTLVLISCLQAIHVWKKIK